MGRLGIFPTMDQRMARCECHLPAGHAFQRKSGRRQHRDILCAPIVRVNDVETLGRHAPPQAGDAPSTHRRQLEMFLSRTLGERAAGRANDQLTMSVLAKASRQRQQQILTTSKLLSGVDVRNFENSCCSGLLEFDCCRGTFRFYRSLLRSIS